MAIRLGLLEVLVPLLSQFRFLWASGVCSGCPVKTDGQAIVRVRVVRADLSQSFLRRILSEADGIPEGSSGEALRMALLRGAPFTVFGPCDFHASEEGGTGAQSTQRTNLCEPRREAR